MHWINYNYAWAEITEYQYDSPIHPTDWLMTDVVLYSWL